MGVGKDLGQVRLLIYVNKVVKKPFELLSFRHGE